MTIIVPTSEEDPLLIVVRFTAQMSWADAGQEVAKHQVNGLSAETEKCIIEGRCLDLTSLILSSADLIFSKASKKGLLHEGCVEKMRLLTLVDLGMTKTGQIPYSMIKDTLKIDDIEVESWVVKVISAKLLICKIDQMNQVITMSRCTERVFGTSQWQLLRAKLVTWRGNIACVICTIHANKIVEDSTQTMQGLAIH